MSGEGIWTRHGLKAQIVCLVNYANVFNDSISREEVKRYIKTEHTAQGDEDFDSVLQDLITDGWIEMSEGYLSLPHKENITSSKKDKVKLSGQIVEKRIAILRRLHKLPFIRFVGISGALAAKNPTPDKDGIIDIDIFIITERNFVSLVGILAGLYTFIRSKVVKKYFHYPYCFNYIMDASDVEIYNKNFYTATEIKNLLPVAGVKEYLRFIAVNQWATKYYPNLTELANEKIKNIILRQDRL